MTIRATFDKLIARRIAIKERKASASLEQRYDPAPSAETLPRSALQMRRAIIQRRIDRKKGNNSRKVSSAYSATHMALLEGARD